MFRWNCGKRNVTALARGRAWRLPESKEAPEGAVERPLPNTIQLRPSQRTRPTLLVFQPVQCPSLRPRRPRPLLKQPSAAALPLRPPACILHPLLRCPPQPTVAVDSHTIAALARTLSLLPCETLRWATLSHHGRHARLLPLRPDQSFAAARYKPGDSLRC
jgi:hypothetical protein